MTQQRAAIAYTKVALTCPACQGELSERVLSPNETQKITTACQNCGKGYTAYRTGSDWSLAEKPDDDIQLQYLLVRLNIPGKDEMVYHLSSAYRTPLSGDIEEERSRCEFWVEEHTCPTNIIGGDALIVVHRDKEGKVDTDDDPHGYLVFIGVCAAAEAIAAVKPEAPHNLQSWDNQAIAAYIATKFGHDLYALGGAEKPEDNNVHN